MEKILGKFEGPIYSAFRAVAGFLFTAHGIQKILGGLGGLQGSGNPVPDYLSVLGFAGFIELIGGVLIMVGLFTSLAAFLSSGLMAFAYFMVHARQGLWPILNHGELTALYSFAFLFIAAKGDGSLSLSRMVLRR